MDYPSKLVGTAVEEIAKLPGIGRKTALRLVLHLLKQPESFTHNIAQAMQELRQGVTYCNTCHIIADTSDCTCQGMATDNAVICVVEDTPDALAVRATGQYRGMFHVLGGRISPVDGIGPEDIQIDSLVNRLEPPTEVREIILALSSTMEGDTTAYYITKQLERFDVKITTIARGIPVGGELEYADELTLGKSIAARTLFSE